MTKKTIGYLTNRLCVFNSLVDVFNVPILLEDVYSQVPELKIFNLLKKLFSTRSTAVNYLLGTRKFKKTNSKIHSDQSIDFVDMNLKPIFRSDISKRYEPSLNKIQALFNQNIKISFRNNEYKDKTAKILNKLYVHSLFHNLFIENCGRYLPISVENKKNNPQIVPFINKKSFTIVISNNHFDTEIYKYVLFRPNKYAKNNSKKNNLVIDWQNTANLETKLQEFDLSIAKLYSNINLMHSLMLDLAILPYNHKCKWTFFNICRSLDIYNSTSFIKPSDTITIDKHLF